MRSRLVVTAVLAVGVFCLLHFGGAAQSKEDEAPWPKAIGGEVKYRVDKANADKYRDQMPEGLYRLIKDWDYSINVYETVHDYKFPAEYLDATDKYKGTARVNGRGGLENYTAGLPFPEPKTGAEAVFNYEYKYSGDDFKFVRYDLIGYSATGKAHKLVGNYTRLGYQGRVALDPTPGLPNPNRIELKEISGLSYPEDVAGLALLTVRYQDPAKGDEGWMYIPTIRRVRRISVAQRGDTFGGLDYTWDDYRGFSGKVSDYTWKLVGKKDMLVSYHAPTGNPRAKGLVLNPEDVRFELRSVWIADGVNKDKDYVYSKRRIYFDADSWGLNATEVWDRRGNLFKYGEIGLSVDSKTHNAYISYYCMYDLIAKRSSHCKNIHQYLNLGLKEDLFTTTRIQTWGR